MREIERVLSATGSLIVAVLAGDPKEGLPDVQFFDREMFDTSTEGWQPLEVGRCDDIGCTAADYPVWYGVLKK
jgi:hypothetical protein